MSPYEQWIRENLSWFGFVLMVVVGSIVAHIKSYEASEQEWPVSRHFWGIVKRLLYGLFAGLLVYFVHNYYKWDEQLAFVATGICAVFATDLFDFLWKVGKDRFAKFVGVEIKPDK